MALTEEKFRKLKKRQTYSIFPEVPDLLPPEYNELKSIKYPFENLVFEGGGARGASYYGAIKILEEVGIRDQIKRIAGASAGAMTALIFVCGCTGDYLKYLYADLDFQSLMDAPATFFCFGNFGRRSGDKIYNFFGEMVKYKFGKADLTFLELYQKHGRELCVIVTNLNYMDIEYCHVKTTPNMPIRLAVRMSLSVPIEFEVVRHKSRDGVSMEPDLYTDGGLLCNFPIHCFDGWYLSMNPEDNFLSKLRPHTTFEEKFSNINWKTMGCLLYSDRDTEIFSYQLRERDPRPENIEVESRLFRQYKEELDNKSQNIGTDWMQAVDASETFLVILREVFKSSTIDSQELKDHIARSLKDPSCPLTDDHITVLFGQGQNADSMVDKLDSNGNGTVSYEEVVHCMYRTGIDVKALERGYERRQVNSFTDMLTAVLDSLFANNQRLYIKPEDIDRTIGIDTFHVSSTDWDMETTDKDFLTQQGARVTISFLRRYSDQISNHEPKAT